jgi:hypothetical protein
MPASLIRWSTVPNSNSSQCHTHNPQAASKTSLNLNVINCSSKPAKLYLHSKDHYSMICMKIYFFMLGWPCSMNYMNNNQHNALFIFSLLSYHTLHVLGVSAAHHQEVECIYVANGTCYTVQLTVSRPAVRPADSQLSRRGVITQWTEDKHCICWLLIIYYFC